MRIAFSLAILLSLLFFPQQASEAARQALSVWGLSVVPSLFPYMVFCRLLSARLKERRISAVPVAVVLGLAGGSPSGASVIASYGGGLSPRTLLSLCAMTGTISPMFTLGTLLSWTQNAALCRLLLLCHLLSAVLCGGLIRLWGPNRPLRSSVSVSDAVPPDPLSQSIDAVLQVGGCIICYSVLAGLLRLLPFLGRQAYAILHSLLEISGGIHALCLLSMPHRLQAICMAALCGFSGFSILSQNHAFLAPLGVRMGHLMAFALLRAVLAGALAAMLYAVFIP